MQASWQQSLQNLITKPSDLLQALGLSEDLLSPAIRASEDFALRVPQEFLQRIKPGDIHDPLLRQVLPIGDELSSAENFVLDPLQEQDVNPIKGLLHKYHGRVLLTVAPSCAINCRYCFRRHFPYSENNPGTKGWGEAIEYIQNDNSIHEVIYSGGDPLMVADEQLAQLTQKIETIEHVSTLRIHTRLPIVIPQRIDEKFLAWVSATRLKVVLVIHSNHAQELDDSVQQSMAKCLAAGVVVLNQSVLLRGVNDSVSALSDLSRRLFEVGVLPYYLHLLDKVKGAQHFDVSEDRAKSLIQELLAVLPGYLVPKLVQELPNNASKIPIDLC